MYKITSIEDQQKFLVPLNDITEKLWYNQRMIVDTKVSTEPRAWEVSKVNRISPNGLVRITLAQDNFDQHNDFIERDLNGNIIGMWADYYKDIIKEEMIIDKTVDYYSSITYSGVKPQIKIGGSYKKFTVNFYENESSEKIDFKNGQWRFFIKERESEILEDAKDLLDIIKSDNLDENQIKLKFIGDSSNIGKILVISYLDESEIDCTVEMEITGL